MRYITGIKKILIISTMDRQLSVSQYIPLRIAVGVATDQISRGHKGRWAIMVEKPYWQGKRNSSCCRDGAYVINLSRRSIGSVTCEAASVNFG